MLWGARSGIDGLHFCSVGLCSGTVLWVEALDMFLCLMTQPAGALSLTVNFVC